MNLSSLIGLIGNLIPLAGVFYWQWDPFQLLMLYWLETMLIVIGLKTLFDLGGRSPKGVTVSMDSGTPGHSTKQSVRLPD